jgi:serine phosphatase RsbU (regulator of sigma subunit)
MQTRAQKADQIDRYKSEVSETLHRINRLVIPPYLLLISYLAFFADHLNYPQFSDEMFVGRAASMIASAVALTISWMAGWSAFLKRRGSFTGILTMCGVAFMITHFAAVMQNHFSAQTAWIVGNIIIGGLYPVGFAWSAGILIVSYLYYLGVYLGVKQGPIDLQFQMTLLNSGIAGVTALAIKYGFIVIRKREFFSRVRLEQANQQIALLNEQLKDENLRMSHELDVARKIQHIVLPSGDDYRDFADLDIACVMVTAEEVGGDYYDIIRFDGQNSLNGAANLAPEARHGGLIAIGDVTGHGLNSGVLMMMVHATLRALSEIERKDIKTIYRVINKILYDFRVKTEDTRIMTLALLRYFGEGRFTLTGEHECILRIKAVPNLQNIAAKTGATKSDATIHRDPPDPSAFEIIPVEYGMYAGLEPRISDEYLKIHEFELAPGETIILYTDGITEAVNDQGVEFGQHGIINAAYRAVHTSPRDSEHGQARMICDAIMHAAREYSGPDQTEVLDDYSLVVLQRRTG